jgi:cytochrome c oxidase assembly protein subunit 15
VFAVVLARKLKGVSRKHSIALHSAIGTQILLGIWTLWSGVDLHVAVAHQATAVLVVASFVAGVHRLAAVRAGVSTSLGTNGIEERGHRPLVPSEAEGR